MLLQLPGAIYCVELEFTTASCREFITPVGAVPFAITQPALRNTGVRPGAAEQPWSARHRTCEEQQDHMFHFQKPESTTGQKHSRGKKTE